MNQTCTNCGVSRKSLNFVNSEEWVCDDCMDLYQDKINKLDDMKESQEAFRLLKINAKGFKLMYDSLMYHSENSRVVEVFNELEGLLNEFEVVAEKAEKHIRSYY